MDGEVVAVGDDGRPSFQSLQRSRNGREDLKFFVFDVLEPDGKDLRKEPLERRREALARILPDEGPLRLSPELRGNPEALLEQAHALHLEGIIAKKRQSVYEDAKRSGSWVKCMAEKSGSFVIGGYVPNGRNFSEFIIGQRERQGLRFIARVKAGSCRQPARR